MKAYLTNKKYAYWFFAALHIFPVWFFQYFPTSDGASHIANAGNILKLLSDNCDLTKEFFEFTKYPIPNLISHGFLALLLNFFSPIIVDKIIISAWIILFFYSVKLYINNNIIFLIPASIFVFNMTLFMGSYNFLFSTTLGLIFFKIWADRFEDLSIKNFLLTFMLSLILYFFHFFGFAFFCLAIFITLTTKLAYQKNLTEYFKVGSFYFLTTVPLLALFAWYYTAPKMEVIGGLSIPMKAIHLLTPSSLHLFSIEGLYLIIFFTCSLWTLLILQMSKTSIKQDGFNVKNCLSFIAIALFVLLIFMPGSFAGGWMIEPRLSYIGFLSIVLWLGGKEFSKAPKTILITISSLYLLLSYSINVVYINKYDGVLKSFSKSYEYLSDDSTILEVQLSPLILDYDTGKEQRRLPMPVITGYYTADKCVVNVANFHSSEKNTFPVSYKASINPYDKLGTFRTNRSWPLMPPDIDIDKYEQNTGKQIDYIIVLGHEKYLFDYKGRHGLDSKEYYESLADQLSRLYEKIHLSDDETVRVYKRKN